LYLEQVYDQTIYIHDALGLVQSNIWIGGALAVMVLLVFLRSIRSVGIIALAIPISVIGAIVAMVAMGRTINVVSLAGMAFAVGMVVDNAIVVLENIFRHLEMGKAPMRAAYDGTREVWGAVLGSTLTTVFVFVPILLIQEEAGQLFRDIALAICAAVMLSLIVSITVIPVAAARILKPMRYVEKIDRRPKKLAARIVTAPIRIAHAAVRFLHGLPDRIGRFIEWSRVRGRADGAFHHWKLLSDAPHGLSADGQSQSRLRHADHPAGI
jgi:HAE1 family hydrophobic/amphiphilic exporter-1